MWNECNVVVCLLISCCGDDAGWGRWGRDDVRALQDQAWRLQGGCARDLVGQGGLPALRHRVRRGPRQRLEVPVPVLQERRRSVPVLAILSSLSHIHGDSKLWIHLVKSLVTFCPRYYK